MLNNVITSIHRNVLIFLPNFRFRFSYGIHLQNFLYQDHYNTNPMFTDFYLKNVNVRRTLQCLFSLKLTSILI